MSRDQRNLGVGEGSNPPIETDVEELLPRLEHKEIQEEDSPLELGIQDNLKGPDQLKDPGDELVESTKFEKFTNI